MLKVVPTVFTVLSCLVIKLLRLRNEYKCSCLVYPSWWASDKKVGQFACAAITVQSRSFSSLIRDSVQWHDLIVCRSTVSLPPLCSLAAQRVFVFHHIGVSQRSESMSSITLESHNAVSLLQTIVFLLKLILIVSAHIPSGHSTSNFQFS